MFVVITAQHFVDSLVDDLNAMSRFPICRILYWYQIDVCLELRKSTS